jgi:hypothetical protein
MCGCDEQLRRPEPNTAGGTMQGARVAVGVRCALDAAGRCLGRCFRTVLGATTAEGRTRADSARRRRRGRAALRSGGHRLDERPMAGGPAGFVESDETGGYLVDVAHRRIPVGAEGRLRAASSVGEGQPSLERLTGIHALTLVGERPGAHQPCTVFGGRTGASSPQRPGPIRSPSGGDRCHPHVTYRRGALQSTCQRILEGPGSYGR